MHSDICCFQYVCDAFVYSDTQKLQLHTQVEQSPHQVPIYSRPTKHSKDPLHFIIAIVLISEQNSNDRCHLRYRSFSLF